MKKNKTCLNILRYKEEHPIVFYSLIFYLGGLLIYVVIFHIWFADYNKPMPLNEVGDFLAGVFAPLAFLFLILGYLQTNKSLGQNSEAIAQQAIAIQQQSLSLQMQADELKISNESLQRQVEEMSKSVKAQQDMFNLAEQQYHDSINEKAELNKPKLAFFSKSYSCAREFGDNYSYRFNLTIKNSGIQIKDIIIHSNFWVMLLDGNGQLDNINKDVSCPVLGQENDLFFLFYMHRTNLVPFQNNTLRIKYKDINGIQYDETYSITKSQDSNFINVIKTLYE